MQIFSFSPFGYEGSLVTIEVDLRRGIPCIDIVGLADGAVKESRERMQAAIRNSGYDFPPERVLISLSPADLKKEGAGFDLPIALAVLYEQKKKENLLMTQEDGQDVSPLIPAYNDEDPILIMGELELSGKIRPIKGVHAAASTACNGGILKCIVPKANADEAREVNSMKVFGADNLEEAFEALGNNKYFTEGLNNSIDKMENYQCINGVYFDKVDPSMDYKDVKGQEQLVRALQIAASGGHNLLAVGEPGCGKTLSIQKFPSILPLLTKEEAMTVTRIRSLAGLLKPTEPLVVAPPFRMPHQTATIEGICGGGQNLRPGEISLSHNGVLFLDEATEFRTSVLQMLRVPLENERITLSRAGRATVFPANFQLLMAINPCPCGNFGSQTKLCLCSARSIEMYWKKISAPLLDRIDLRVHVNKDNINEQKTISSDELREQISLAVSIQRHRGKKNSKLTPGEIVEICKLDSKSSELLHLSEERYGFSPRGVASVLKVSRTIADMKGIEDIDEESLKEAINYRKHYNNFMALD